MMNALLVASLFAASAVPDYALLHILRNSAKVTSVDGVIVQSGIIDGADVKAAVVQARPDLFSARVTEPAAWAGISVIYDGHTLQSYYPQVRWAIRLRNLKLPEGKDLDRLVEYQYGLNQRTYDYIINGTSMVAGLSTLTLHHKARSRETPDARGWTKVYDPYSFAMAGEYHFPNTTYAFQWDSIAFNKPVAQEAFSEIVPEGTLITDWDLGMPSIDEAAMRKEATFHVVLPDDNRLGLKRTLIARAAGPIPAFCIRYERGPHVLLVTVNASAGASVPAYGVPIGSGTPGRLIPGSAMSSYAFVRDGSYYTLLGNLPIEELLKIAAQLNPATTR